VPIVMGTGLGLSPVRFADLPLLVKEFGEDVIEFDAEDLITLRKNPDGGAPTGNGETVGMWVAHSVYGYYGLQNTSSRRPTRVDAGPDGRRWLYFDAGDIITTAQTLAALSGLTSWECWVRVKVSVLTASAVICEHSHNVTAANGGFLLFVPSGTTWSHLARGNVGQCQRSKAGADTNVHTIRITGNFALATGEPDIYIDGSNAGTTLPSNSNNTGGLGDFDFSIGARWAPGNFLNGYIRRVVIFNRLLSAGEVTFMDTYMAT
jgi:hypothetical protein